MEYRNQDKWLKWLPLEMYESSILQMATCGNPIAYEELLGNTYIKNTLRGISNKAFRWAKNKGCAYLTFEDVEQTVKEILYIFITKYYEVHWVKKEYKILTSFLTNYKFLNSVLKKLRGKGWGTCHKTEEYYSCGDFLDEEENWYEISVNSSYDREIQLLPILDEIKSYLTEEEFLIFTMMNREIISFGKWDNLTLEEIGELLNCAKSTVSKKNKEILNKLQKNIKYF